LLLHAPGRDKTAAAQIHRLGETMTVAAGSTRSTAGSMKRKQCALFLGCLGGALLTQQLVIARSADPVFFPAVSLSAPLDVPDASFADLSAGESASFAAFVPMADSSSIRALIAAVEAGGDYDSPLLAEQSAELGKALQAEGQYRAALAAYDRSLGITRRHEGLFSSTQALLLQAKIEVHLAIGDIEAADALQQSLFLMQQQLFDGDAIALAEAHQAMADWNLKLYLQAREILLPGGRTPEQEQALDERLAQAFMQYHKSRSLLAMPGSDGETEALYQEKVQIERRIAALTLMANRQHQQAMPNALTKAGQHSLVQRQRSADPLLFRHGSSALQRAIDYSMTSAAPVLVAERQLELADWYLLLDQHAQATTAYTLALAALREAGIGEEAIAAILDAGLPVHDPEDELAALVRQQPARDIDGYVDVAFELDRYGKASKARVVDGSERDEQIEQALLRQIRADRFRPGVAAGTLIDQQDVTLRYYYTR
jgi:hypothetical protein